MLEEAIKAFVGESDGYEIYEDYSGRGMFGRTCLGVVIKRGYSHSDFLVRLAWYLSGCGITAGKMLEGVSVDELGLDTIVYFPQIRGKG